MAVPEPLTRRYSPAEYLDLERQAEQQFEYVDGYILAIGGGTPNHSRIKVGPGWLIRSNLDGNGCELFDSDLMVKVDPGRYTYPDLTVVCGQSLFEGNALLNPTVLFEVLSPSTEAGDRGEKWGRYRRMASLRQYVLVGQDRAQIEVFTRQGEVWTFSDAEGVHEAIHLEAIDYTLPLGEVYARVAFDPEDEAGQGVWVESPVPPSDSAL